MRTVWRIALLLCVCTLALQLYFLARVALMRVIDPRSTTFQRSEAWRLVLPNGSLPVRQLHWRQQWVDYAQIATTLKRAVIASEDAGFTQHGGVEWDAIERAWERNQKAQSRSGRIQQQLERRARAAAAAKAEARRSNPNGPAATAQPKLVGGSTITQQLAKNLFLDGERNLARKGQEFVITLMLEALLPKQRILEIYLNHVEWGEGLFGAEAASLSYFNIDASALGAPQAARLAVMLPAPKRFQARPATAYVLGRAATVAARMAAVQVP